MAHLFQGFQEWDHIQVIIPDQNVAEGLHAFLCPGSLADGVIFFAQLSVPQPGLERLS